MLWFAWALLGSEIPYDGIDQDGDGVDLIDVDGDGEPSVLAFGRDCNDRDPTVGPGARDRVGDGVDSDCDGGDGPRRGWPKIRRRARSQPRSRMRRPRAASSGSP